MKINVGIKVAMKGEMRAILRDSDGSVVEDTGWFGNTIVNNGLDLYGFENFSRYGHIGSSAAATSLTQTTLTSRLATSGTSLTQTYDTPPVAPDYERRGVRGWRFGTGVGTGTVREIGVGVNTIENGGDYLFARHVLPAEIVKGSNQTLDVYWALTKYMSQTDATGQVIADGITYDYICRWQGRTASIDFAHFASGAGAPYSVAATSVWDGDIGAAITDFDPQGSQIGVDNSTAFVDRGANGTIGWYERSYFYDLDQGDGVALWRTFKFLLNDTRLVYHVQLSAVDGPNVGQGMPKDNTEEVTVTFRTEWSRYP